MQFKDYYQIMGVARDATQDGIKRACRKLARLGGEPERWRFSGTSLPRARKALRLQRDIGFNFAGAALEMELMDEIELLRTRLRAMGVA